MAAIGLATAASARPPVLYTTLNSVPTTVGGEGIFYISVDGDPAPTYQWQRLAVGAGEWVNVADGGMFSGATTTNLHVTPVLAMDGDQFRIVATNLDGSVTSNAALLTVTIPLPPTSSGYVPNTAVALGRSASFAVFAHATGPYSFRWQRQAAGGTEWEDLVEGGTYTGVTTYSLAIPSPTMAMNGDRFRAIVSNVAGTFISEPAILTVYEALPPFISGLPAALTAPASFLGLKADIFAGGVFGSINQWWFNGAIVSGGAELWRTNPKVTDSGVYTLTVTDYLGQSVSASVNVTVAPPGEFVVSNWAESIEAETGSFLRIQFQAQAGSSDPSLGNYRWYRNGVLLPNATYSFLDISGVKSSDAGQYTAEGTAGAITVSRTTTLTVVPRAQPKITTWRPEPSIVGNEALELAGQVEGATQVRWFRDGVLLPGVTVGSYDTIYTALRRDAGTYWMEARNETGLTVSPDAAVSWVQPQSILWVGSVRQGDIVYFAQAIPARLLRYDLAQEQWLPEVPLPGGRVPSLLMAAPEGIYIAYGQELVRHSLDLQTEEVVATTDTPIKRLFLAGDRVVFQEGGNFRTLERTSLVAGPTSVLGYSYSTTRAFPGIFSERWEKLFVPIGESTTYQIDTLARQANGKFVPLGIYGGSLDARAFPAGEWLKFSPDESQLVTSAGTVFSLPDVAYQGSLGVACSDLGFLDNGEIVAVRDRTLTTYAGDGSVERGRAKLTRDGLCLFVREGKIYVFGAAEVFAGMPGVDIVAAGAFVPLAPHLATSPIGKRISLDEVFVDAGKVLNLVSRSERGVVRWDPLARKFLPTIPLRGRPQFISYAPALDRLVLAYSDGMLTDLFPVSAPTEQAFASIPMEGEVSGMVAADALALVDFRPYNGGIRLAIGSDGETTHHRARSEVTSPALWNSAARRLISFASAFEGPHTSYAEVGPAGEHTAALYGSTNRIPAPLRPSADGQRMLALNGTVWDDALVSLGRIGLAVTDGAWLPDALYTVRPRPGGTLVQKWNADTFAPEGTLAIAGVPQRILRVDDSTLVAVTLVDGYLAFTVVSHGLEPVSSVVNDALFAPERPALFNGEAYLAHNPDVAGDVGDVPDRAARAWEHYWRYGIAEGRSDGDFGIQAYLAQYPDLAAQFGSDLKSAALHWYTTGRAQGLRIPAGFDVTGYFARNQDIATIFASDKYGAWLHYYNYGVFEGRSFDTNFIPAEYLELNADLKAALGGDLQGATMHWLQYGHPIEDRMGRVPVGFNVENYFTRYPDLEAAFANVTPVALRNVAVWNHYIAYGTLEARSDGDFEANNYLATNADLAAVFGTDVRAAAMHWYFYGRREGRRIPPGFDVHNYRAIYPDLEVFTGDDLYGCWLHYRDVGINEGRYFNDLFRPADYLALNPDVAAVLGNNHRDALLHWLYYGQYEGRPGKF
jgi:hypothetical protein